MGSPLQVYEVAVSSKWTQYKLLSWGGVPSERVNFVETRKEK